VSVLLNQEDITMKNRAYWISRIEQHLADLASASSNEQRERILRRVAFATRKADQ
jgi:hypothetical protein